MLCSFGISTEASAPAVLSLYVLLKLCVSQQADATEAECRSEDAD